MKRFLVISALGNDRPGIVNELSRPIVEAGCNIDASRMAVLGGEFALMLMISGNWSAIAKLESQLPGLEKKLALSIFSKATEPRPVQHNMVPYVVDVVAMDHPGIVHHIADFFAGHAINIEEMSTWTYPAAHTGTPMFSLSMTISVPAELNIGRLRHEFTGFCDDLNLDATLEPARN